MDTAPRAVTAQGGAGVPAADPGVSRARILVVEDSRMMRAMLLALLAGVGHRDVLTADSAASAFQLLGVVGDAPGAAVDLILMDLVLPDLDGLAAIRAINAVERLRGVPIIMVTGMQDKETLRAAFEAGATDFLTKPIDEVELLARVGAALRLKREIDRREARERELVELGRQLEDANRRLEQLSLTDGLTGVANRRHFDGVLQGEWNRASRDQVPLSLILIDLDHFKRYNDARGHQEGDECLRRVAAALAAVASRPGDLVARYGGEEFAAILPDTDAAGALVVGERLRAAVAALALPHGASPVAATVTLSAGVAAIVPAPGEAAQTLIAAADAALYRAKAGGRDRVVGETG